MINNDSGLSFHHLGLAVKEPSAALTYLKALGYRHDPWLYDPLQNVKVMMCWHDLMPAVEVIFPGENKGPLDGMLAKRPEGLVYHLCYASAQLSASIESLRRQGLKIFPALPPRPSVLFGGKSASFYLVAGMGLIEIIEI